MRKPIVARCARTCSFVVLITLSMLGLAARAQSPANADALLAIDQQRASVVERIIDLWGPVLAKSSNYVSVNDLRERLLSLRADALLAASLAGTEKGLREVTGLLPAVSKTSVTPTKALGDTSIDVVYTPVTPCRLVETRGTFAAVYQGNGTPAHTADPFTANQIRTYTIQGGNGVCLTQLPAGLNPAAVQLQVFGLPTTATSGDIEILPQGSTFGSTATMVYVGTIAFDTVSTTAKINPANNEISVQVRGGGANLAMDVVGYFAAPSGNSGKFFMQGGNTFGATAALGTKDNQPLTLLANNQTVATYLPNATSPNFVGGQSTNSVDTASSGQTITGGGAIGSDCLDLDELTRNCINQTSGDFATIGGGVANQAAVKATVGGGESNTATGIFTTVAGGVLNFSTIDDATVGGGNSNVAQGIHSTVGGGFNNLASGLDSTVGGGSFNAADGEASVVPGGNGNAAVGAYSFAAGYNAVARGDGSFVWSDDTGFEFDATNGFGGWGAGHNNTFSVRATGGVWFLTGIDSLGNPAIGAGVEVFPNQGAWSTYSDRNGKDRIEPVDPRAVLEKLLAVPVATWKWKGEDERYRHMGPMAQDFYAAFGLGADDRHIVTVDADGVSMAAIQGLHQLVQEKDARIDALEREVAELRQKVEDLIAHSR